MISRRDATNEISNHATANLSELDMRIVRSVPEGGNWKNIPEDIPSKRLSQIRESFRQGLGSRSTYYGRLSRCAPSYTINTYFNRPGNGCHIHYVQDRVLSQREAARLQSFPDNFKFFGSQSAINTQIGNAVPPLLAFQIAKTVEKSIGGTGCFIDLFSGAGGIGLGFKWAGWQPLVASDISPVFLKSYAANVHEYILTGDMADASFLDKLCDTAIEIKRNLGQTPFWVLGGPPCQGFSTAGKKRSMEDERNLLFLYYKRFLSKVKPDGFVFENVAGLLNMDNGNVFKRVKAEFSEVMPSINGWVLNSESYAIPQRRKRVFLLGVMREGIDIPAPHEHTSPKNEGQKWITVEEAISDLPVLTPGEDGSLKEYLAPPCSLYQQLMRGVIDPSIYLREVDRLALLPPADQSFVSKLSRV